MKLSSCGYGKVANKAHTKIALSQTYRYNKSYSKLRRERMLCQS